MTTTEKILVDLLAGQSTSDAIADRLDLDPGHVDAILRDLVRQELAIAGHIAHCLVVYRLTSTGSTEAIYAKPRSKARATSPAPMIPH